MNNNTPASSLNSNHPDLPSSPSVANPVASKNVHKVNGTDNSGFCSNDSAAEGISNTSPTRGNNEHPCNTCQQQQRNGSASSSSGVSSDPRNHDDAHSCNNANSVRAEEDLSTEDEDGGDSDDQYCVYTYKGDGTSQQQPRLAADLPSSFFKFHPSDSSCLPPSHFSSGIPPLEPSSSHCCHPGSRLQNGLMASPAAERNINPNNNEMYSPDMDFLEMDFDPGGSGDGLGDADSEDESEDTARNPFYDGATASIASTDRFSLSRNVETSSSNGNRSNISPKLKDDHASSTAVLSKLVVTRSNVGGVSLNCSTSSQRSEEPETHCSKRVNNMPDNISASSCGNGSSNSSVVNPLLNEIKLRLVKSVTYPEIGSSSNFSNSPGESAGTNNSINIRPMAVSVSAPVFQDKLEKPCPTVIPAGKSSEDTMELEVDGVMIWSIQEAQQISICQIGRSACGATACLNVLSALGCIMTTLSPEFVSNCVGTRLRAEDADLPEYLLSRSNAGTTHEDLIAGIHRASNGLIYGRFFQIKPNTPPSALNKWLLHWICKGCVPVATLNLQVRRPGEYPSEIIPDAWHHQMIFGLARQGIFLTNPLECVPTAELIPQLSSPSVLLIRRDDVTKRTGPRTDLRKLARFADSRWNDMNVLGQVSNMLLEEMPVLNGSAGLARRTRTARISIPAAYTGGITLFVRESNSTSCALLKEAAEF